ncbi:PhzF family phenazine biosynthesis protein [Intestinibacter sp.]
MKKYQYKKVDAFTSGNSMGNPAAYIQLHSDILLQEDMLNIGKEHKGFVSEIVFCQDSKVADIKLTYYSSECEVDFCGHGTIATMYELIKENEMLRKKAIVTIDTNKKGILPVYNRIDEEDAIYIAAPEPIFYDVPATKREIADGLGIQEELFSKQYPFEFIDAGLRTLIVPIENLDDEISLYPDEAHLKVFCESHGIDIILLFSKMASDNSFVAHTRVFAPKFGYLEDPATGSGNSAFGYYMLKHKMWNGEPVSIEQGGNNINFNTVKLIMKENKVCFGGKATLRIEGIYYCNPVETIQEKEY